MAPSPEILNIGDGYRHGDSQLVDCLSCLLGQIENGSKSCKANGSDMITAVVIHREYTLSVAYRPDVLSCSRLSKHRIRKQAD
jgi:hypothetical protein